MSLDGLLMARSLRTASVYGGLLGLPAHTEAGSCGALIRLFSDSPKTLYKTRPAGPYEQGTQPGTC